MFPILDCVEDELLLVLVDELSRSMRETSPTPVWHGIERHLPTDTTASASTSSRNAVPRCKGGILGSMVGYLSSIIVGLPNSLITFALHFTI